MTRTLTILVLLVAVGVRVAYFLEVREANPYFEVQIADCAFYDDWASGIAAGEGSPPEAFYQPPLYPFLVGAVYRIVDLAGWRDHRHAAVYGLQLILGVFNVLLAMSIARRMFGPWAGVLAGALLVLHANLMFWEVKLLISTVGLFLGLLTLRLLLSASDAGAGAAPGRKRWLAAGLFAGLLSVARADKLIFLPLATAWVAWVAGGRVRDRLAAAASFAAPAALVVLLCLSRNVIVAGDPVLVSANGGVNFYFGNHLGASGINMAPSEDFGSLQDQRAAAHRQAERDQGRRLNDAEVSSYFFGQGLRFIRTRTDAWLELMRRKLELSVGDLEADIGWSAEAEAFYAPILSRLPLPFGVLLGLGVVGLAMYLRVRRPGVVLLLLFALSSYLVLWLFFMGSRFRLPAVPCLAVLSAGAITGVVGWLRQRAWLRSAAAVAAAVAIAAYAHHAGETHTVPGHSRPMRDLLYANATQLIGQAHADIGQVLRARDAFLRVLERDPDAFKAWFSLGRIAQHRLSLATGPENRDRRSRLRAEAIDGFEHAARLHPTFPESHLRLGELYADREEPRLVDAIRAFGEAVRLDPANLDARLAWIEAMMRAGRAGDAKRAFDDLDPRWRNDPRVTDLQRQVLRQG